MKKILIVGTLLLTVATASFGTRALFCIVSSDSSTNNGFCRENGEGGDTCYLAGSGVACNGTGGWVVE
ncbi:MAG: hypothetical protein WAZ98_10055 [Cyclobacteriaceae bacterium]